MFQTAKKGRDSRGRAMGCNRTQDMISNLVVYGRRMILTYQYMAHEDLDKITLLAVYLQFTHQRWLNKDRFGRSFDR